MANLFVPPGHFYSPIPDANEVAAHLARLGPAIFRAIPGIDLDDALITKTWDDLLPLMRQAPFQDEANASHRYHWQNAFYSYGDAAFYDALIADRRPARIIEIGSGFSSALALDTRDLLHLETQLTFIEPYPDILQTLLRPGDGEQTRLIRDRVQNVDTALFAELDTNDILFIDSSHVLKTGSDVCFELFEILPSLKPGVIVHFHDVFYPFEYPQAWVLHQNRAWNELYALRAFLMYNRAFKIFFFNDYFRQRFPDRVASSQTVFGRNPGGGLWLTAAG